MSQPTSLVVSVHTTDVTPDRAKYRISAKPGEDLATAVVRFTTGNTPLRPGAGLVPGVGLQPSSASFDTGNVLVGDATPSMTPYIAAIRLVAGVRQGTPLARLGCVCGLDRCGAPGVKPLHVEPTRAKGTGPRVPNMIADDGQFCPPNATAPFDYAAGVKFASVAQYADGDVEVDAYALIEPEGWF
jgi:hypothetical protein